MQGTRSTLPINDLPQKALKTVFGFLSQNERQLVRPVCSHWNHFINQEFPVELFIINANYEHLFKCVNAKKVTIYSLTTEFQGPVGFKDSLKTLVVSGKVLSSNIIRILSLCHELQSLVINSPKQVMGIENHEMFGLPKLTDLEFRVRMDQETFTSDEMILLNTLANMKLGSLEKVLISVKMDWDEEGEDLFDERSFFSVVQSSESQSIMSTTLSNSMSDAATAAGRPIIRGTVYPPGRTRYPSMEQLSSNGTFTNVVPSDRSTFQGPPPPVIPLQEDESVTDTDADLFEAIINNIIIAPTSEEADGQEQLFEADEVEGQERVGGVIQTERPVQVDVSVGMTVPSRSRGGGSTSTREPTYSRVGLAEFEFASRLFANRLQFWARNSNVDLDTFLNDPVREPQYGFIRFPGMMTGSGGVAPMNNLLANVEIKTTAFFELLKNNADNLKSFLVKARPDFLGFGNISTFPKEVIEKIQLQDIEYSFGRSKRLCSEHLLLEQQGHLCTLKLHILDDLWNSVAIAAEKSQSTFSELDVKILSLSEDPINLMALSKCKNLKILKLFHFFEKENLQLLPSSLVKLVINGPVTKEDLSSFASRLENLAQFDLILNFQPSEKIDLPLFRRLVSMPNIRKLVFIQTQIDVDPIAEFCQNTPGIVASIQGPKQLREPFTLTSAIQYVSISVTPPTPE